MIYLNKAGSRVGSSSYLVAPFFSARMFVRLFLVMIY